MKKTGLTIALGVLTIFSFSALAAEPELSIEKAVSLAREQLKMRNLDKTVTIQSVALESTTLIGGRLVWKVSWSDYVDVGEGKTETGVEVSMKGEVVRLVKRQGSVKRHP